MSDNLPPEVVQEELEARFRIPTEVWTDVFKLLPRRVLVQQIAPVCFYFKEISDKNVKNVHMIENAIQFSKKLEDDDPETNQHLEQLAGSNCQLAGQFKLSYVQISEKSQAVLCHCTDLFIGCQIGLDFNEENKDSPMFLECFADLEMAKPVEIRLMQHVDQAVDFWHHPTYLNCTRARLFFSDLPEATRMTAFANIFEWIHHQTFVTDCDDSAQQVRCMIISSPTEPVHIDWLIDRCTQDIQQAQESNDHRPYVLSFWCLDWTGFGQFRRIENHLTGEMLVLDRVMSANGQPSRQFRLRRCLAEDEASGEEFYAGMFNRDNGIEEFNIDESKPRVMIR